MEEREEKSHPREDTQKKKKRESESLLGFENFQKKNIYLFFSSVERENFF